MRSALTRAAALAASITLLSASTALARPILVVGGDHKNPPYEYIEEGKPTGFNVELMRAAAAIAGFEVDIRLGPWIEARRDLEQGNVDALSGMYYSDERSKLVEFSVPHTMVRSALFVRKDSPIRSFADLRGKEVILQEGDVLHDLFKRTGLASRIVAVTDADEQLRLLASGRHDCALMTSRLQGEYYVKRLKLTGLRIVDADLPQLRYCFAVRKGDRELLHRLDEGLNILKVSGKYQEIYERWFGVYESRDLRKYGRYFALGLAILVGLFTASLLWSRSLKQQVVLRTAALQASEEELRQAHAELERRVEERTAELSRANEQLKVSEAEKAIILNSTGDLVTFLDREMRIQWGNHRAAALAGTSLPELRGRHCWEAFHGRSEPCPSCPVVLASATGEPQSAELSRPGGRTIFLRAYPIKNEDGCLLGTAEFVIDITERKRMEEALRESEARYARLAATVPGVLYEYTKGPGLGGRFTYLSPRCSEIFEVDARTIEDDIEVIRKMADLRDLRAIQEASQTASRTGAPHSAEVSITTPSGRQKWLHFLSLPCPAAEGAPEMRSGLILDVTERKRTDEALRESEEWLKLTIEATGAGTLQTVPYGPAKVSARLRQMFGIRDDFEIDFDGFLRLVHLDDRDMVKETHSRTVDPAGDGRMDIEFRCVRPDGDTRWIALKSKAQFAEADGVSRAIRLAAVALDVTDRKREEQTLRGSEERFHTLADNIAQLAWMADAHGEIFWFNRRCLDYTGATPDALQLGRFLHPDHVGRVAEEMGRCFSTGELFEDTFPLRGKGGSYRWFLSRAVPVRDQAGQVVRWLGTATDVTDLREVEEALRESEARGQAILASLAEGVVFHGPDGVASSANDAALKLLGLTLEELTGRSPLPRGWATIGQDGSPFPAGDYPTNLALRTGRPQRDLEMGIRRPDGTLVWLCVNAEPVRITHETMAGVVVSLIDITERSHALRKSEEHLRTMADNVPDAIVRFDRELRHVFANVAAAAAISAPPDRIVGKTAAELGMPPEHVALRERYLLEVFRTGTPHRFEFGLEALDGRQYESRLVPEHDRDGVVETVLAITRDITERKHAEHQLLASREQLRELVARMDSVREEEKTRLSRDLHDEMGQLLTALRMELEVLEDGLGDLGVQRAAPELLERAVAASELVAKTIGAMHDLLRSLRPVALDRLGLGAALRQECRRFKEWAGVPCEFAAAEALSTFGPDVDTALFRIAQEALTNIARHAHASRAAVTIETSASTTVLRVEDDGRGIPPGREPGGLGMVGMRERAERLGGELVVMAAPRGGTVLEARIPSREAS